MNEKLKPPFYGQCLCGTVKYRVDVIEAKIGHCHCSMCRKFHGSAFATYANAKKENFQWLAGESALKAYKADNQTVRRFCSACGSSMTFADDDGESDKIVFALGTLDSDIDQRPVGHIYTDYKANWVELNDDLPKYKEGGDSEQLESN